LKGTWPNIWEMACWFILATRWPSLAASGGIWAAAATAQLIGALDVDGDERSFFAAMLIATDLGLVGGALLASELPVSPGRALLIDGGGLLGTLTGLGVSVLVQGDDVRQGPTLGAGLVGTLSGLGLAYYLTRDWDAGAGGELSISPPRLGLLPVPGGLAAAWTGVW
jgi:hypothetical protein